MRRWHNDRRHRFAGGKVGCLDLLGKLYAPGTNGDVPAGRGILLRTNRGRPGSLDSNHAAYRPGRTLLRAKQLPISDARRISLTVAGDDAKPTRGPDPRR